MSPGQKWPGLFYGEKTPAEALRRRGVYSGIQDRLRNFRYEARHPNFTIFSSLAL
jgi:hypothetical protein